MNHFLLKTEPSDFSFADLQKAGNATWDGVSNNTTLIHLRGMKKGDQAFIYHSGEEKAVVGVARIASAPYADPKLKNPKLVVVDIVAEKSLPRPVTLAAIKADAQFKNFALVNISRLSVMPVSAEEWSAILQMAGG